MNGALESARGAGGKTERRYVFDRWLKSQKVVSRSRRRFRFAHQFRVSRLRNLVVFLDGKFAIACTITLNDEKMRKVRTISRETPGHRGKVEATKIIWNDQTLGAGQRKDTTDFPFAKNNGDVGRHNPKDRQRKMKNDKRRPVWQLHDDDIT